MKNKLTADESRKIYAALEKLLTDSKMVGVVAFIRTPENGITCVSWGHAPLPEDIRQSIECFVISRADAPKVN